MNSTQSRHRQHRDYGFRYQRHVNHNTITFAHTERSQAAGQLGNLRSSVPKTHSNRVTNQFPYTTQRANKTISRSRLSKRLHMRPFSSCESIMHVAASLSAQCTSIAYLFVQLIVRHVPDDIRHRTVVYDGHTAAMSGVHMPIDRIVTSVQIAARKPFRTRRLAVVQHLFDRTIPVDELVRQAAPEALRIGQRSTMHLRIVAIAAGRQLCG